MRLRARTDGNQRDVVARVRSCGYSVWVTSGHGHGAPDFVVGGRPGPYSPLHGIDRYAWPVELKDGSRPPSERRLTPDEQRWHDDWRGPVHVCESADDVLRLLGVLPSLPRDRHHRRATR